MKIAVIGGRDFVDYNLLEKTLNNYLSSVTVVVSGGAKGADRMGEYWAKTKHIPTLIFKPDWNKFGKSAGFVRNLTIIENADIVIAFWDGKSRGTLDSINKAEVLRKSLVIISYK